MTDIDSLGEDRPLSEEERLKLRVLRPFLIAEISLKGLLFALFTALCISERQKASIEHPTKPEADQISELCDVLERRSYAQYKTFVRCCLETHPEHVARTIEATGGKLFIKFDHYTGDYQPFHSQTPDFVCILLYNVCNFLIIRKRACNFVLIL